jgi:HSP20 family protein
MTLTRWQPYRDLVNLRRRFNQLFDESEISRESDENPISTAAWYPAADIYENKDEYVFKVELPGISKDDVNLEFEKGTLTIKGERKVEKEVNEENYHRFERAYGTFSRSFSLPRSVDDKKISAKMKDGILELKVPKAEEAKPKAIPIKID